MQNEHPLDFTFLQIHGDDGYRVPWGLIRESYYAVTGYSTTWFDGHFEMVGDDENEEQGYARFLGWYNERKAVPTDVRIELGGVATDPNAYSYAITARLKLDPDGVAKTVRLYLVHALDHYPSYSDGYRNCLRNPTPDPMYVDVALTPGQIVDAITWNITFDTISWNHQNNIRIIAWAQVPTDDGHNGQGELWNAAMMSWPFASLPPLFLHGDMNCDGDVDFFDIDPFVLALSDPAGYVAIYPECHLLNGDCNGDGALTFDDIDCFIALLSGR